VEAYELVCQLPTDPACHSQHGSYAASPKQPPIVILMTDLLSVLLQAGVVTSDVQVGALCACKSLVLIIRATNLPQWCCAERLSHLHTQLVGGDAAGFGALDH